MSNSDKKLNGGRSNPITLNAINEKVRTLEGAGRVTPIKMSDLDKRVNNLQNKIGYTTHIFNKNETWTMPVGYENADVYFVANLGWEYAIATSSDATNGNITFDYISQSGSRISTISFARNGRSLKGQVIRDSTFPKIKAICIPK